MSTRSVSVDTLKAIAIFGVVFIHGANCLGCESDFTWFMRSLFRFAVPCFVIVWAYFVEKSLIRKSKHEQYHYLKQRFVHLFIVFFSWSLLYFFLRVNWHTLTPIKVITSHFSGFGWAGQYFFVILFQLIVLFPALRWIYVHRILRIAIITFSVVLYAAFAYFPLLSIIDSLGDRMFIYWLVYVFLGIALARGTVHKLSAWWLFVILLVPLEEFLMKQKGVFFNLNEYIRPTVLLASVVISIVAIQYNTIQYNTIQYNSQDRKTYHVDICCQSVCYSCHS